MTMISGGKVLERCTRCQKVVQMNRLLGGWHFCVSDCKIAGEHLQVREEIRGILWWRKTWAVCDTCGRENPVIRSKS